MFRSFRVGSLRLRSRRSVGARVSASALVFAAVLSMGLGLTLAAAGTASAQARVEERLGFAVTGDVKAVDAAANTITVKSTNDDGVVYAVAPNASVMRGGKKIALADLQVGWNVVMNGQADRDGKKTATLIKVTKAPSAQ